ncbi:hypothetical protein E2C01_095178 [Portunus trituberculatus]|uniref:Uncharacterized protein n=1 Tax=Portunus trituberculatus TaxID=210409 RepID=A0A5B7JYS9_PORTR|nr:hypothetical protein [Portunus trituberculatus]
MRCILASRLTVQRQVTRVPCAKTREEKNRNIRLSFSFDPLLLRVHNKARKKGDKVHFETVTIALLYVNLLMEHRLK